MKKNDSVFNKIQNTINNLSSEAFLNQTIHSICDKGVEIANEKYSVIKNESVQTPVVVSEQIDNNTFSITATGEGIWFEEYGVGREGEGSYEGNLPTDLITFETADGFDSTQGWEYYYPSKYKVTMNGQEGWMHNNKFMTGETAGSQMYNTAQDLRQHIKSIIKQQIKENFNGKQ